MRSALRSSAVFSSVLLLVACGSTVIDKKDAGESGVRRDATGTGGILGTGGSAPGSGGISGTGGRVPGAGGIFATGGTGSGGRTNSDTGLYDSGAGLDGVLDAPVPDAPMDSVLTYDADSCQAPKVWRYQQPGCGADAHPVCGTGNEDACLRYACGCDGEILEGCDYYSKPWRSAGLCPDTCFSPTQNLNLVYYPSIKGCACNPASDLPQCAQYLGLFSCVGGAWTLDQSKNCAALDAGTDSQRALDAPVDSATASGCDVAAAQAAMAALGLVAAGSATTLNDTLPSPISGPNWGLKSTACQDGGYDISGLAGQTVCLVKQPIAQACAQAPDFAWAVMTAGQLKCVYESAESNPGIYAVGGYVCP